MQPINFTKYYIWTVFLDIFMGMRLLQTLKIIPQKYFDSKIRMIVGIAFLICFFMMYFTDKVHHRDTQALSKNRFLWIMVGVSFSFLIISLLAQDYFIFR